MSNPFGVQTFVVSGPGDLLVPSAQALSSLPPVPTLPVVDHFACYSARGIDAASRNGPRQTVELEDLFGSSTARVGRPTRLCLPADTNGASPGAENHPDALLCYRLYPTRRAQVGRVFAADEFGQAALLPQRLRELCVPSERQ